MSEGLTKLENLMERQENKLESLMERQASRLDRIEEAIQGQNRVAEAQARTAEAQTANIAALTQLVEMVLNQRQNQDHSNQADE